MGDDPGGVDSGISSDGPFDAAPDGGSRRRWLGVLVGCLIVAAIGAGTMWRRTESPAWWVCVGPAMDHEGPVAPTPEAALDADRDGLDFGSLPGPVSEYERREIDGHIQFWRRRGSTATLIWVSPAGSGWATSSWALGCQSVPESFPGSFRR